MLTKRGCHGCGAPLPEHTTTCAYCGSTHDNVTFGVHVRKPDQPRYASNASNAPVISAQRTMVMTSVSSVNYYMYFDGQTTRRVRIG